MEIAMRPVQAMQEEKTALAEVSVRTVPGLNRWNRTAAAVAEETAAQKGLAEGGLQEEEEGEEEEEEVHDFEDRYLAVEASKFRDTWNQMYSSYCGDFEDTTKIPNKRFTNGKPPDRAAPQTTLQVFSLKIAKLASGLQWPLQVFGMVAIRDCIDHNRNIIFYRPRNFCQIVTREDPYLNLTGPMRAVVVLDPATFEVNLKVKGTTESKDQWLSFLAVTYHHFSRLDSHLLEREYASKLSELQFQLGSIVRSVEATIEVQITSGSWPRGLRAQFTAGTASIPAADIVLLDCSDGNLPALGCGGSIKLSRCVAAVEIGGELQVFVKAFLGDKIVVKKVKSFRPKKAGVSYCSLTIDFYKEIFEGQTKNAAKGNSRRGFGQTHGVGFLGCCTLGFNISWSVISVFG